MKLSVSTWKYGKRWVYSATYDEALAELHRFVVPHHDALGIPGHVEAVSGHIGRERQIGQSSYNGFHHMDGPQMRELLARGWGVGCHSWSHFSVADDPETELYRARLVLEEAIGRPVTVYCSPGSNVNMTPFIIEKAKEYGYLAGMSITDALNLSEADSPNLFYLNRPPLHEKFSDLYDSVFDAHKRITQAKRQSGWIIDYLHCPLERAVHDYKDCSAAHHLERLEAVAQEGKYDCWFANPDDAVDYRYLRRYGKLTTRGENRWDLSLKNLPPRVRLRELSFELETHLPPEALTVLADETPVSCRPLANGVLAFDAAVRDGMTLRVLPRT